MNRPIIMLALMVLPLLLAARYLKLYPSKLTLYLAAIPCVSSVILSRYATDGSQLELLLFWFVIIVDGLLLAVFLLDGLITVMTRRAKHFSCSRTIGGTGSLGKKYPVQLRIVNRGKTSCRIVIRDDLPPGFTVTPAQFETKLRGQSNTEFEYDYVSDQSSVNVYPDIQQISEYDLLARTNRLSLLGMRRSRSIGQDNEFERLRDYTQDDNFKHIDWRSTARRQKLTVRDYQANQSQQIIFMIDCGRMMTGTHGKTATIDHAINAMLMLSYIALRQGDSVGLITFSNEVHNFTPPKSGVKHINRLLHATFDQSANHVESRYDQAFLYLRNKCPKRSLVVTITNLIDEINSSQVQRYMSVLSGRHLPLAVLLRDRSLFSAIDDYESRHDNPVQDNFVLGSQTLGTFFGQFGLLGAVTGVFANRHREDRITRERSDQVIYEAAAAASILSWRHQMIQDLKHRGILTMDAFPEELTASLVNRYLDIKARHLL